MYTYKSFRTSPYNQKHENNFRKYFLGLYLKRFPICIQIFNQNDDIWT